MFVCQEDQEELSPSPTDEPWPKKFPEPLSWRSDEEDEDSDFGEEQRDRYLKVYFNYTFLKILFNSVLSTPTDSTFFFFLSIRWATPQSTRSSSSSCSDSSALCWRPIAERRSLSTVWVSQCLSPTTLGGSSDTCSPAQSEEWLLMVILQQFPTHILLYYFMSHPSIHRKAIT